MMDSGRRKEGKGGLERGQPRRENNPQRQESHPRKNAPQL
jgi:hypothetical protein